MGKKITVPGFVKRLGVRCTGASGAKGKAGGDGAKEKAGAEVAKEKAGAEVGKGKSKSKNK